jgi:hypothetical protein
MPRSYRTRCGILGLEIITNQARRLWLRLGALVVLLSFAQVEMIGKKADWSTWIRGDGGMHLELRALAVLPGF